MRALKSNGSKRLFHSRIGLSIFLTLIILTSLMLVNVQTAGAVKLTLPSVPSPMCEGNQYTITAQITIESDELVPLSDILLTIDGATPVSANFYVDGTEIPSWSPKIVSVTFLGISHMERGVRYGYGYGYQSGYGIDTHYWDWGYGSGYGYGYGAGPVTLTYEIVLDTTGMTPGAYNARLRANLEGSSDYFLSGQYPFTINDCGTTPTPTPTETPTPTPSPTPTETPTPTPTPTPTRRPGGGGGYLPPTEPPATPAPTATAGATSAPTATPVASPTGTPAPHEVEYDILGSTGMWMTNGDGVMQDAGNASSPDEHVRINIPAGAQILGPDGQPIDDFSVSAVDPLPNPPPGAHVLAAFDFEPGGTTFSPGIEITIAFDLSEVAEGEEVVIAFLNEATGEWEFVTGTINSDGTATFTINHCSIYAVLAKAGEVGPTPTTEPAAPWHRDTGVEPWVWIAVAIMGLLVLVELIALILGFSRKGKS
jgi:hypothetical protein